MDSLVLLYCELAKPDHHMHTLLAASAIGLHSNTGETLVMKATSPVCHDLLADLTQT